MSIDPLTETRRKAATQFFQAVVGLGFLLTGVLAILLSLDVIEYVDLRPNRIAIFNDPHTWQVFVLGVMFTSLGLAGFIPVRMRWLGRMNIIVLLVSFLAVVVGIVLEKLD